MFGLGWLVPEPARRGARAALRCDQRLATPLADIIEYTCCTRRAGRVAIIVACPRMVAIPPSVAGTPLRPMTPTSIVAYLTLFLAVGALFPLVSLVIGWFLRAWLPSAEKLQSYECGEQAVGSSFVQFDLRFYVIALVFLIFEVEVAFFFPWAVVFGKATQLKGLAMAAAAAPAGQRAALGPTRWWRNIASWKPGRQARPRSRWSVRRSSTTRGGWPWPRWRTWRCFLPCCWSVLPMCGTAAT